MLRYKTFGACSIIHTDSGCQITSAMFRDYCQFIGANHRISSVRYPQSNGLAQGSATFYRQRAIWTRLPQQGDR